MTSTLISHVDLDVDSVLLLGRLTEVPRFPIVLALMPNVYNSDDQDQVDGIVRERLQVAGILDAAGAVHPEVRAWIGALAAPDRQLHARVIRAGQPMLRVSIVRAGGLHVMAMRCDDHVVLQPINVIAGRGAGKDLAAALAAVLGDVPSAQIATVSGPVDLVASDAEALREVGASRETAETLARAGEFEADQFAEIGASDYSRGPEQDVDLTIRVVDTIEGRIIVAPHAATHPGGDRWVSISGASNGQLAGAIDALCGLMASRRWFELDDE